MNRKAFSLAEMMVVMLILSIIIAASMPIITKRTAATESPNQNKIPPGSIMAYGGTTAPSGWLLCNGQSTNGHQELAAVVGANVPDLRGEFIRGWDNGRGVDVGRMFGSWQMDAFKSHSHTYYTTYNGPMLDNPYNITATPRFGYIDAKLTSSTGDKETRPRNIALNYIIKY